MDCPLLERNAAVKVSLKLAMNLVLGSVQLLVIGCFAKKIVTFSYEAGSRQT
jgi:hypothetical protein